ncbi:hypothetical protein SAMN02927914_05946 [Mesorhizobium qingshengii]|uniref:Uncharacterized protein n=1 Tax=Mesorhizobium qingshengii TaxID=1165689 RepID=A0A1G5ZSQ9_9HYPH|nr:hypothetical protein SAMN02927914_05946 [Mesorhizobium qingshengii]
MKMSWMTGSGANIFKACAILWRARARRRELSQVKLSQSISEIANI